MNMPGRNEQIVTKADLQQATGYQRDADIERWLRKNRVRYWTGKAGPFTTVRMMEEAKVSTKQSAELEVRF